MIRAYFGKLPERLGRKASGLRSCIEYTAMTAGLLQRYLRCVFTVHALFCVLSPNKFILYKGLEGVLVCWRHVA